MKFSALHNTNTTRLLF